MDRSVRQSTAATLRTKLAQATPLLRAAAAGLWQPAGLSRRYPEYLRAMHGVIRASVPLMELAVRRCLDLGPCDPVAGPLREYLDRHIVEERDHDEWLLADFGTLGADTAQLLAGQPSQAVARLVGPQYYWIEHHHPVALLGYIAVMEGNAPAARLGDWIVATTGVPDGAVRTVRAHAELDGGHTDAVYDLLESLPLTSLQANVIAVSGLYTVDALIGLFGHIVRVSRQPHASAWRNHPDEQRSCPLPRCDADKGDRA